MALRFLREDAGQHIPAESVSRMAVLAFADVLERRAAGVPEDSPEDKELHTFYGVQAPGIGIDGYLMRIFEYFKCSRECFVVAAAYLDRLVHMNAELLLNSLSIHRLLLTSIVVAVKFQDDIIHSNAAYAKIGGVSTSQLNRMESTFLRRLRWHLSVSEEEFERYNELLYNVAKCSGTLCPLSRFLTPPRCIAMLTQASKGEAARSEQGDRDDGADESTETGSQRCVASEAEVPSDSEAAGAGEGDSTPDSTSKGGYASFPIMRGKIGGGGSDSQLLRRCRRLSSSPAPPRKRLSSS
eukprot:TRINITY_DN27052_c0_g1_i1.p1 TRINITY_DN27052_c0_g1~~TRINITY_DN27052_c0_g1_i1.p1  ORF type:complete len:297 (+),score=64.31 TRINITY_DN27052_c0_g1_i1:92-982(+)